MKLFRLQWGTRTTLWIWIAFWGGLFVATHIPAPDVGSLRVRHFDKVIHFALYFLLTWIGGRHQAGSGPPTIRQAMVWAGIYLIYAGLDEWLQTFVNRSMTVGDWIADAAGVAAATGWLCLHRRRTISERSRPDRPAGRQ